MLQNPQSQAKDRDENKNQKLETEILRIRIHSALKSLEQIWSMSEEELCVWLNQYEGLPFSRIKACSLFEMDRVKLIRSENKIYLGQISQKKKEGKGLAIYQEGRIYEGEFTNNEKNEYGCEVYPNGNFYAGEFSRNKKHGKGSFYWFSLTQNDHKKEERAKIEQYHGHWWGGLPDGQGEHLKVNGDYYVGSFKNGLKHGDGQEKYGNGDHYKGQFINGFPQGYGEYLWGSDLSHYKGDFKQGYRNGYGVWREMEPSEAYYKGHYVLDKKQGFGIQDWGNGYEYHGHFSDDVRAGEGELYFKKEIVYKGWWENGEKYEGDQEDIVNRRKAALAEQSEFGNININEGANTNEPANINSTQVTHSRCTQNTYGQTFDKQRKNHNSSQSMGKYKKRDRYAHSNSKKKNLEGSYLESSEVNHRSGHRNCKACNAIATMPKPQVRKTSRSKGK